MKRCSFSIIIPSYYFGTLLRRCLAGISAQTCPVAELIVVFDREPDSEALSLTKSAGAKIVLNASHQGDAGSRNAGAKVATSEVLLFVDEDVELHPDVLALYSEAFTNDSGLAAAFGCYDDTPSELNFFSQYKNLLNHFVHQNGRENASTFCSAFGAVRRSVFVKMAGFSTSQGALSISDIELGYRIRESGHSIRLIKEAQAKHLKRWTFASLLHGDVLVRAPSWTQMLLAGGRKRVVDDLNIDYVSRASVALAWSSVAFAALTPALPLLGLVAGCLAVLLFVLNNELLLYFFHKRGLSFGVRAALWHFFFYFYCGVGFLIGALHAGMGKPTLAGKKTKPLAPVHDLPSPKIPSALESDKKISRRR